MNMEHRKLPKKNITEGDIINGECDIPSELYVLVQTDQVAAKRKRKSKAFAIA